MNFELKLNHKILILIFLIALTLRLAPVIIFHSPVLYDYAYHERISENIIENQTIPLTDISVQERPYTYPPFYHLLLAFLSIISGLSTKSIIMFLLPFIASLLCLSIYVLIKKISTEFNALLAAFLTAIAPPLINASFDSPENIVFFSLPLTLLLILKKKELTALSFLAFNLFWNYLAFAFSLPAFFLAFLKEKNLMKKGIVMLLFSVIVFSFLVKPLISSFNSLSNSASFVANNLSNIMLPMIINFSLIALPVFIYSFNKLKNSALKYWFYYALISFLAMISYIFTSTLRPWEQPKIFSLGLIALISSVKKEKIFSYFILFILIISFLFALSTSFQTIYPKIPYHDFKAISFALSNSDKNQKILAEPTLSEEIISRTGNGKKVLTALYFESNKSKTTSTALKYLNFKEIKNEKPFLKENNVKFLLFNFEDTFVRGTKEFNEKKFLNKVYSLSYNGNCILNFLPTGFLCGKVETAVYEFTG